MTDVLRLGVVGTGLALRKLHLPVLAELRDRVHVGSLVATSQDSAESAAALFRASGHGHAAVAPDIEALLEDNCDAVLVAVPIHLTAEIVEQALRAGKHVLAEKPLADTPDRAMSLVRLAAQEGVVLAVGENHRFRPDYRSVRQFVESGVAGELRLASVTSLQFTPASGAYATTAWRQAGTHAGGYLVDGAVHVVTGLREMVPRTVLRLTAEMTAVHPEYLGRQADTLLVNLAYDSGLIGHLEVGYGCHEQDGHRTRLYGTEGTIALTADTIELWSAGGTRVLAERDHTRGFREEWEHFLGCVAGGQAWRPLATESVVDLAVVTGAIASAGDGRPLDFPGYLRDQGVDINGGPRSRSPEDSGVQ